MSGAAIAKSRSMLHLRIFNCEHVWLVYVVAKGVRDRSPDRYGPLWPNKAFVALAVSAGYIKLASSPTNFSVDLLPTISTRLNKVFIGRMHVARASSRFRRTVNLAATPCKAVRTA